MKRVGYLGPPGTFSQQAAIRWLERNQEPAELVPFHLIPEILQAVEEGSVSQGVVPVENSIEGTVNLTLDGLLSSTLYVQGEVVLEVDHCLVGKGKDLPLKKIYSHPQALAQCRRFLAQHFPQVELVPVNSTAEAARLVAGAREKGLAAIASSFAARYYGLAVIREGIQDYPENKTRFFVVGRENNTLPTGKDKTSLVLALPQNRPGGLYEVLREFACEQVDLTKIESRPTKRVLGEYLFYLDCRGHCQEEVLARVLTRLQAKTAFLRVLGSYPIDEGEQV